MRNYFDKAMKQRKIYCEDCSKVRKHIVTRDEAGAARIFLGLVTLGGSELFNRIFYRCKKCGMKSWDYPY